MDEVEVMEREFPTIEGPSSPASSPRETSGAVGASVDADAASRIASSLRRRPGHVVVTAPFATTAARLFEMAETRLGSARVLRIPARLLIESEVSRALAGVAARGLPAPSPAAVAAAVEEAGRQNHAIVVLVEDADAVTVERLDRVREMLIRTPAMRENIRLVLLGSGQLQRLLETPEAKRFADDVALHVNVSSSDPVTVAPEPRSSSVRRARPRREASRFLNEKLLVLAVGAVLVTGVLLFPIEPTVYPPRPAAVAPVPAPGELAEAPAAPIGAAPARTTDAPTREGPAAEGGAAEPAGAAGEADRRFRPPPRPGRAFQVGAFRDRENAVRLAERLVGDFDGVYIDRLGEDDASLHRVRVPIPATVLGESTVARALAARGLDATRVE